MKPDVLEQIKTLTADRTRITDNEKYKQGQLCREVNGKQEILKPEEIVVILTQQENTIKVLQETIKKKDSYIRLLESKMSKSDDGTIVPDY